MNKNTILIVVVGVLACCLIGVVAVIGYMVLTPKIVNISPTGGAPIISLPAVQAADARPLGLYEGLASLNSYHLKMRTLFIGPGAEDYNESVTTTANNQDGSQFYSKSVSTSSSKDEPTKTSSTTEEYRLGQKYCTISTSSSGEKEAEVSNTTPAQQSMMDAMLNIFDITVASRNAKFASAETINGIPTNHFNFTVSGLSKSGAEVTQSQGEYWLAKDGQYLVKYQVTLELKSGPADDPTSESMHVEIQIELSDVNTAITVEMPAECNK